MATTHLSAVEISGALTVTGAITPTGGITGGAYTPTTVAATGAISNPGGTLATGGTFSAVAVNLSGTLQTFGTQVIGFAAAVPAAPSGPFYIGNIVFNTAPAASGPVGWACTAPGTPGTWKAFGTLAA